MSPTPFVSVLVRSYQRPKALLELVERLRAQRYAPFEVVIVEQSADPTLVARLAALDDPRLHVVSRPPLGAAGARNEAVRHARGEILLFIDDDDLPAGDDWIALHVANYATPLCMGIVGHRWGHPAGPGTPRFPRLIRWLAVTHTMWMDTREYAYGPLRKHGVAYLHGTNSSVRRSVIERIGGWDEVVRAYGEEQSFAFKWRQARRPGEYFAYDPRPTAWRRFDIPGGCARRAGPDWFRTELAGRLSFYHHLIGHYFPWRFRLLYPLYLLRILVKMVEWLWEGDNAARSPWGRLKATLLVLVAFPAAVWRVGWRDATVTRRVPALAPVSRGLPS